MCNICRRHELVALKREKEMWREAAKERARRDFREERERLEEELRDKIAWEGPDVAAMKSVGLVRVQVRALADVRLRKRSRNMPRYLSN